MKNILVPTDFSAQADYSLHVAAQLAKKHGCEIYLLHMLELPLNEVDALSSHSELPEAMFYMKLARKRFDICSIGKNIWLHNSISIIKTPSRHSSAAERCYIFTTLIQRSYSYYIYKVARIIKSPLKRPLISDS